MIKYLENGVVKHLGMWLWERGDLQLEIPRLVVENDHHLQVYINKDYYHWHTQIHHKLYIAIMCLQFCLPFNAAANHLVFSTVIICPRISQYDSIRIQLLNKRTCTSKFAYPGEVPQLLAWQCLPFSLTCIPYTRYQNAMVNLQTLCSK